MIRVVLIDNHSFFRRVLRRRLEGFELVVIAGEAENGQGAIALIDSTRPDLVLMEIELPGMDGAETGSLVKENYPDITVALYTLLDGAQAAEEKSGLVDYCLRKDTLFDSLVGIISNLEKERRSSEQGTQPV